MNLTIKEITLVAIFPALMAATAWIAIPFTGAPITLQTLFVMMAGLLLGKKLGTLSMVVYVVLGAIGLPIFASFNGGIGYLVGPTGGFILGFIVVAFFIGIMKNVKIINNEFANLFLILVLSNIILYMIGGTYLAISLNLNAASTIAIISVYFIGDMVKIVVAIYAYLNIRSHVTYEHS